MHQFRGFQEHKYKWLASFALALLFGCASMRKAPANTANSAANSNPSPATAERQPAAGGDECADFDRKQASGKMIAFMGKHQLSAIDTWVKVHHEYTLAPSAITDGSNPTLSDSYIGDFVGGAYNRGKHLKDAVKATTRFLSPSMTENFGYKSMKGTFARTCENFEEPEVKKVHALGTLASAHMVIYPRLKVLDENDAIHGESENPWTGLFDPRANEGGIPMLVRFSIANPIGPTIIVGRKSLLLEFIPGLGFKFLIDGKRSIDLVSMESLAGQGKDQNYFKYEVSSDFSAHAPSDFNTSTGAEQAAILARYNSNPVNHWVMNLVGKRFAQVIPYATTIPVASIDPHSSRGPHSFSMSIANLAATDKSGNSVEGANQHRPWRLVFKPALDNLSADRRERVTDATPYHPGRIQTDFRYKLAGLKSGDRLYYVIGETEAKKRFIMGEVVLDSTPVPSEYADRIYFIQHRVETARGTPAISEPL